MAHFYLRFVWCEEGIQLHCLACRYSVVSVSFLEKTIVCSIEMFWYPCQKSIDWKALTEKKMVEWKAPKLYPSKKAVQKL